MSRLLALLALVALLLPAAASGAQAKVELYDVEDEVMCVTCNIPLHIASSEQADRQRVRIEQLIAQGMTKQQVLDALVEEYGSDVLALPDAGEGAGAAAYVAPAIAGAVLLCVLVLLLPRWRRRARVPAAAAAAPGGAAPAGELSDEDRARLDEELRRTDA